MALPSDSGLATETQSPATVHPAALLQTYSAPAVVWHCWRYAPVVSPGVAAQAMAAAPPPPPPAGGVF